METDLMRNAGLLISLFLFSTAASFGDEWRRPYDHDHAPGVGQEEEHQEKAHEQSELRAQRHRLMATIRSDAIIINEVFIIENSGDRTIGAEDTFIIQLPRGARAITLGGEFSENSVIRDEIITFAGTFPPGIAKLMVQYSLPYGDSRFRLTRQLQYDTDLFDFIFPDMSDAGVESVDFDDRRHLHMGPVRYHHLTANDRRKGTVFEMDIKVPSEPGNDFKWPALGLTGLAVTGFLFTLRQNPGIQSKDAKRQ